VVSFWFSRYSGVTSTSYRPTFEDLSEFGEYLDTFLFSNGDVCHISSTVVRLV